MKNSPLVYVDVLGLSCEGNGQSINYIEIDGRYYVQSSQGNVEIDAMKYYETNSSETVILYADEMKRIDLNFQNYEYNKRVDAAMPDQILDIIEKAKYVANESKTYGNIDQKQQLSDDTLYLFEKKLYNKNEAGNIIWGATLQRLNIPKILTSAGAHGYTLWVSGKFDETWDVAAWTTGWKYENQLEIDSRREQMMERLKKIR